MSTHLERLQQALAHIDAHLAEDELSASEVAAVAGYSPWHFQRLFAAVVGESVMAYVRRRRLTAAWAALAARSQRILDVAVGHGFESQAAFSRAFKAHFGVTPGTVRRGGAPPPPPPPRITQEYLDHLFGGLSMTPKFIDLSARRLIGLRTTFVSVLSPEKTNHTVLPRLWADYLARRTEIKGATSWVDYGVCEALAPERARAHADEYAYLAGAEVAAEAEVPAGMTEAFVAGGRYAVFTHKGPLSNLEHTMRYIYGAWLPRSGHSLRAGPDLEVYGERFAPGSAASELDIMMPLEAE